MASNSHQTTLEGNKKCCFKFCSEIGNSSQELDTLCSRVEVKAFEPKRKGKWLVDWSPDGSATFHMACWEILVGLTKGCVASGLGLSLSDVERSMILEAQKTAEFHDSEMALDRKANYVAEVLKSSKYCIAFTGAGISTAAGIGDFRGKDGKWTQRHKAKNFGSQPSKESRQVTMEKLRPTYTHEALYKLMDIGRLSFVISQNVDGLHCLSGIPATKLAELHGNCFVEKCEDCGERYQLKHHYRHNAPGSFPPKPCPRCKISHRTGRRCTKMGCKGYCMNTIINFGDFLESSVLSNAEVHAKMADCVLVLGSSLQVSPANSLVTMGQRPLKVILCNRQTTKYDDICESDGSAGSRVYGDCDILMRKVMRRLLSPDEFQDWEAGKEARMLSYDVQRGL